MMEVFKKKILEDTDEQNLWYATVGL